MLVLCPVIVNVVIFVFIFVVDCPLCVIRLSSRTYSWCLMETVGFFFYQLANVTSILQYKKDNKYICIASYNYIMNYVNYM